MATLNTNAGTLTFETFKCECGECNGTELIEIRLDSNLLTILDMEDIKELVDFLDEYIERKINILLAV